MKSNRCDCVFKLTDLDLPTAQRTWANIWQADYFKARLELVRANKGIRRLYNQNETIKKELDIVRMLLKRIVIDKDNTARDEAKELLKK